MEEDFFIKIVIPFLCNLQRMQRKQLEEIFKLLENDKDKYGVTTMDDLQAQMKLYTR